MPTGLLCGVAPGIKFIRQRLMFMRRFAVLWVLMITSAERAALPGDASVSNLVEQGYLFLAMLD